MLFSKEMQSDYRTSDDLYAKYGSLHIESSNLFAFMVACIKTRTLVEDNGDKNTGSN